MAAVSVAGICVEQGMILLGKRVSGGSMGDRWEFPGGKMDEIDISPQAALRREFYEELELEVIVGECIAVGEFMHKGLPRRLEAYLVRPAEQGISLPSLPLHEHVQFSWVPCHQVTGYHLADSDRGILDQVLSAINCSNT